MDRKWWTLIAVCVATFMLLLDVTIVNVALPSIQTSLKANFSDLQWVVDAYSLMLAALLLTTGALADLWGRRLIFVLGLVVFTGSSLASGLAQSPLWLNLARGAQGVGASAMFSTGLALLGSSFQGRERGVAFGVWGAITGLAVAVGPVVGGGLTTGISWRWIFLVNVPIGVIAVAISLLRVEESKMPHARRPDPIGVITFSGALAALIYALIKGDQKGWSAGVIEGCLIGAGALLIVFLIAELLQRDQAMFDLSLFRKPTFTGGAIAAFGLSGGLFALFLYLTLYLQDVLGYSALQTGLRFVVLSGGMLLTSFLSGRLTSVVPIRFLISPGLLMVAVGLFLMRGISVSTGWTHLIPGFIVAGAGTGLINPPLASTAIGVVRPERAGMASGINSTFRQVGIATGIAGLGAIFSHQVRTTIESLLSGSSQVSAGQAHSLASSVASGSGARAGIQALPGAARATAAHALRAGFASGLNEIFLVGGILSLASAVLTLILIRSKDFEVGAARTVARPGQAPLTPPEAEPAFPPAQVDAVQADADAARPAVAAADPTGATADPAGDGGEDADGRVPDGDPQVSQPAASSDGGPQVGQPAAPLAGTASRSMDSLDGGRNGSQVQVEGRPADIESNDGPGQDEQEATQVREHSTAAGEMAPEEEQSTDGLHQRMSGYGYQAPIPPPPPPPSLVPPGPGIGPETGHGSAETPAQATSGAGSWRTHGYQKPSQAWLAASQAWRTRSEGQATGIEQTPTNVEETPLDAEQTPSNVEQIASNVEQIPSDVGQASSYLEPTPWNVEEIPSDVEQIRSEVERAESRIDALGTDVEQTRLSAGDTSPEAAAARLRSAPASRSFWSRFSPSDSRPASAHPAEPTEPTAPETDSDPGVPEAMSPQLVSDPGAPAAATPQPEPDPVPELNLQPEPDPVPELNLQPEPDPVPELNLQPEPDPVRELDPQPEPDPVPEPDPQPELDPKLESEPEAEAIVPDAGTVQPRPETPDYPGYPPTAVPASGPDRHSDHARGQDVPMSTPPPGPPTSPAGPGSAPPPPVPAPAMRDVRLVVQAVQSAEEAALAYAREISEARRHLASAIEHLDRAEEARGLLNRYAGGFTVQTSGSSATAASGGQGPAPSGSATPGGGSAPEGGAAPGGGSGEATPAPEWTGGAIRTPSPGIAIASPSGPITGPRGSGHEHADDGSPEPPEAERPAVAAEPPASGGPEVSADSSGSAHFGSAPNPPVPPPPRPGGWGPGAGGTPSH